jgi:energy-coupling factor transport system permease protein
LPRVTFTDITLGQFAPRDSVIHRLDPRTKLAILTVAMAVAFALKGSYACFVLWVAGMALYAASRLSPAMALRSMRPFGWLFLLTFGLHAFTTPGTPLFRAPFVRGLAVTAEGVNRGVFYSLRIAVLILYAGWFTLTTSPMDFTDGLERLLRPFRRIGIPAHEIAMMLSIAVRFIPIFIDETERIRRAQISRGGRFDGGPVSRIRGITPVVVPLFLSSFRRAADLAYAMDARCYQGGDRRTGYRKLEILKRDRGAMAVACGFGLMLLVAERAVR